VEAKRVLRSGGRLGISDYVPTAILKPFLKLFNISGLSSGILGKADMSYSLADYHRLARESGLKILREYDITVNTLPTYTFFRQVMQERFDFQVEFKLITDLSEWIFLPDLPDPIFTIIICEFSRLMMPWYRSLIG